MKDEMTVGRECPYAESAEHIKVIRQAAAILAHGFNQLAIRFEAQAPDDQYHVWELKRQELLGECEKTQEAIIALRGLLGFPVPGNVREPVVASRFVF